MTIQRQRNSLNDGQRQLGRITPNDLLPLQGLSQSEWLRSLHSDVSIERTAAARLLGTTISDPNVVQALISSLTVEKSLYTKIELCQALAQGDIVTARYMTPYLGKIGRNQHQHLPVRVSKKPSYPLPRDIIARTLGHMSPTVLPAILEACESDERPKISEGLDALGFMVFHHQAFNQLCSRQVVFSLMDTWKNDMLLLWKMVMCLSAFPDPESLQRLQSIKQYHPHPLLQQESHRSLSMLERRSEATHSLRST